MTVISFPIPAFQNVPPTPQYYQPSRFVITNVTLGTTTIVTTAVDLNYVVGQLVRLIIPPTFGCRQLNESQGYVLSLPASNQVEISVYSLGGDSFVSSSAPTKPQILAIGDINSGFQSSTGRAVPTVNGNTQTEIPGSFINISPV